MTRALWLLLTGSLFSACTTAPVRDDTLPAQPAAVQTPSCRTPEHLVRDLTMPWSARSYVVGPCPDTEAPTADRTPVAPASADAELSAGGRVTP